MRIKCSLGVLVFLIAAAAISGCKSGGSPSSPSTPPVTPAVTVTSISPTSGSAVGGTAVTITGTQFASGATVTFGGTPATGINVASATSITGTTPAHAAGAVDVTVTNSGGGSGRLANGFTYVEQVDVNGSWKGKTANGATFMFTVTDSKVSMMILRDIPGCSTIYGWTLTCQVSGNAFNYAFPSSHPDLSGSITGAFSSSTQSSGNMSVTFKSGCHGSLNSTWTATKS